MDQWTNQHHRTTQSCHEHVNKHSPASIVTTYLTVASHTILLVVAAGVAAKKRIKELEEEKAKLLEELEEAKIGSGR